MRFRSRRFGMLTSSWPMGCGIAGLGYSVYQGWHRGRQNLGSWWLHCGVFLSFALFRNFEVTSSACWLLDSVSKSSRSRCILHPRHGQHPELGGHPEVLHPRGTGCYRKPWATAQTNLQEFDVPYSKSQDGEVPVPPTETPGHNGRACPLAEHGVIR